MVIDNSPVYKLASNGDEIFAVQSMFGQYIFPL